MSFFRILIALVLALNAAPALAVDGTIPNRTYSTNELFKQISPHLSNRHLNQPSVFNGYLVLAGNAVHEVWDISNPYAPVKKATMTSPFAAGEAESHQVTYGKLANGTTYLATTSGRGVDIWNMTVTTNPVLVAAVQLPNIAYGDVAGAIWGLAWQGNYLFLGATSFGLYVLDVSNPADPKLLDAVPGGNNSYIGGVYGGNAYLITPLRTFDVTTDPRNIQLLASATIPASKYVSFADNFFSRRPARRHGGYLEIRHHQPGQPSVDRALRRTQQLVGRSIQLSHWQPHRRGGRPTRQQSIRRRAARRA